MSILVVGGDGNMGKRYRAILTYLGKKSVSADIRDSREDIKKLADNSDGVIITTPTETHIPYLKLLAKCGKPIMCEKPIATDTLQLNALRPELEKAGTNLTMVFQYAELVNPSWEGRSYYDYFKHGGDGLAWDCIQIIGLAKGSVDLAETSPIWQCMVNGSALSLGYMDLAYVKMMERWLRSPGHDLGYLWDIHAKAESYERELDHE